MSIVEKRTSRVTLATRQQVGLVALPRSYRKIASMLGDHKHARMVRRVSKMPILSQLDESAEDGLAYNQRTTNERLILRFILYAAFMDT